MEIREFKRVLQQVMIVPIAALLVLAGVLILQIRERHGTSTQIERSDQRIALANLVEQTARRRRNWRSRVPDHLRPALS